MSDDNYSSGGHQAFDDAMGRLVEHGFSAMEKADQEADQHDGKTTNLFGVLEVPTGMATVFQSVWNVAAQQLTEDWLRPNSDKIFTKAGEKLGFGGDTLRKGVAVASLATVTGIKAFPYINPFFDSFRNQHEKRVELTRKIAPVLDDIVGKHSVSALMHVSLAQNEMIYAHRRRMAMQADTENVNNGITLLNIVPGLWSDVPEAHRKWTGAAEPEKTAGGFGKAMGHVGSVFGQVGASPLANVLIHSNNRKLKKKLSSEHSALEMLIKLADQVEHDPKSSSFELPDGESMPLEEYIVRVMLQHQKDMADISSSYTELRASLKEDIANIAQPLAEAIRAGDMAPLELVRLIGEGKIIKKQGRAIALPEEIEQLVKRNQPKAHKYSSVDSKEFFANASYDKRELRSALGALEGQEREIFASMFPDSILEEAGMGHAEIEKMRGDMAQRYDANLSELISGVATRSDEELKKEGLASDEIKLLRDAAQAIGDKGQDALKEVKSEAGAGHLEQAMTNFAVARINGDRTYIGTLLSRGQAAMKQASEKPEEPVKQPTGKPSDKAEDAGAEPETHVDRLNGREQASEASAQRA